MPGSAGQSEAGEDVVAEQGGQGGEADRPGNGGQGGDAPALSCVAGYADWLTSSFSFPDGATFGADFPSTPWAPHSGLKLDGGHLTGAGQTVVHQGTSFELTDSRLRFRVRFSDSKQEVTVAINATASGTGGVRVSLSAAGKLVLKDGTTTVSQVQLPPLDDGEDRFVEMVFSDQGANARIARKNYPSEPSQLEGTLESEHWNFTANGSHASVALAAGGIAPVFDDLHFSRCGISPSSYEAILFDDFERADSSNIGAPEMPRGLVWEGPKETSIAAGALVTTGVSEARIPLGIITEQQVRIRTRIRVKEGQTVFWANVNYNSAALSDSPILDPGFWVWGDVNKASYLKVFGAGQETKFESAAVSLGMDYFVQLARSQNLVLLSMRTMSFDGPVIAALIVDVASVRNTGDYFKLGSSGSAALFQDILVEAYHP